MTKREVIQTLLRREIPERVGLQESFWPHIIDNAWGAQGLSADVNMNQRFDLDITSIVWFTLPGPKPDLVGTIDESDEWEVIRDGWGSITKHWKEKSGTPEHIGFSVDSPETWQQDFRDGALAIRPEDCFDLAALKKSLAEARRGDQFISYSFMFVFEWMRKVLGDVVMLESLLLEKEFVHDFCTIVTDKMIEVLDFAMCEAGKPDGFHIYEDLGYTKAAFASPACHREMILPYHKKLFRFIKDHNLPIILHTCGDFRIHLDSLVEAGADCIQAMEAKTGMDVVEMAGAYKDKLCFMGNLDVRAFESGDRARIEAEVLGKLNGMRELRAPYIFMSDHSIPPTVAFTDYEYVLDLYRANCRY